MMVREKIYLDFGRKTVPVIVYAKQNDNETREIEIVPLYKSQGYVIEDGITPRLHLTKPDGHCVFDDATLEDGHIIVKLTEQILAVEGMCIADIGLYKDEQLLSSQLFYIDVNKSALDTDKVESSDEYGALKELIAAVSNLYFDDSDGKISLSDYVKKSLTIAGLNLEDDITKDELRTALNSYPVLWWGNTVPNTSTVGKAGQFGCNLILGATERKIELYLCISTTNEAYEWHKISSDITTDDCVKKSFTIAGIDFEDDIYVEELRTALSVHPVQTIHTDPTETITGFLNQLLIGGFYKGTPELYICTEVVEDEHTCICKWEKVGSGYIEKTSIVSSVDENSTNEQVVGAKLFYDTVGKVNEALEAML